MSLLVSETAHADAPSAYQLATEFSAKKAAFFHANLHILFVASRDSHSFSEFMLHAFLTNCRRKWGFNHVRLTNLCYPPIRPAIVPRMDQPTASILIINNLDDLTDPVQTVLRRYCVGLEHKGPFLVLLNVPRKYRCQPGVMHRAKRRESERVNTDFFMTFFPDSVKAAVIFRALACPKFDSTRVVKKVVKWIIKNHFPIKLDAQEWARPSPEPASVTEPPTKIAIHQTAPRPLRYHEYEDLPNPRKNTSIYRKTKSLSVTQLKQAAATTPHFQPEEPQYDAEYDEFRTRRDTRRFVRRLREAMRDFWRVVGQEPLAGTLTVSTFGTVRFGVGSDLTGITVAEDDEMLEDEHDDEDHHDADDEDEDYDGPGDDGDEMRVDWDDDETGTPSTSAPNVSMTSSVAAELEPVILRMRLLQMADRAANTVHTDRRIGPLPVDSLETVFTNSTFRQGPPDPAIVARRVPPGIRVLDRDSNRTATTHHRFLLEPSAQVVTTTGILDDGRLSVPGTGNTRRVQPAEDSFSGIFGEIRPVRSFADEVSLMSETEQEDRAVWASLRIATRAPPTASVPEGSSPVTRPDVTPGLNPGSLS